MTHVLGRVVIALGCTTAVAVPAAAPSAPPTTRVFARAAADAAALRTTVNAYRAAVGTPDNASNPPNDVGRREINWDGVPDARSAPNLLPADFLYNTARRGAVFTAPGNRFQVSAAQNNPTKTAVRFGNLNRQYPQIFATFSPPRLFTALNTTRMSVYFFVPGTNRPATVNGFGAVFTDVDRPGTTWLDYVDRRGRLLHRQQVPPGPGGSRSLSFAGVTRSVRDIYWVQITSGNVVLSPQNRDGGQWDAVAMDDFIYGEPRPVP